MNPDKQHILDRLLGHHLRWLRGWHRELTFKGAKQDVFAVLNLAPNEVPGLLLALQEGRINGSAYEGECACLVGTIANVRGCPFQELNIMPDSNRPAELWFLDINEGDTPDNNAIAMKTAEWIKEWLATNKVKDVQP